MAREVHASRPGLSFNAMMIAEVLYQMDEQLKAELANALDIQPDDIMDYRQTTDGTYSVVLFSFQKFTQVEPQEVSLVPEEMRRAYNHPDLCTKKELIAVAEYLDIEVGDGKKTPVKGEYTKAINHYRLNQ